MSETKLLPCPFCGGEIDVEKNMYIPERDWHPTFYDPDSGGDPINIHCDCGLEFSTGTYDYSELVKAWNTRKPIDDIVERLEKVKEKEQPEINGKTTIRDLQVFKMTLGYAIEIVRNAGKEVRNE